MLKLRYTFLLLIGFVFLQLNSQSNIHKIDKQLLNNASELYDFVIQFKNTDVTNNASKIKGKNAKGTFVYNQLKYAADRNQKRVISFLQSKKAKYQSYLISNCIRVEADYNTMIEISDFEEVQKIVFNFNISKPRVEEELSANNVRDTEPEWGLKMIQADSVWKLGYEGQDIVVGGEDTGYDWDVAPLKAKYRGYENDSTVNHNYNWYDAIKDKSPLSADSLNPCGFNVKEPCDDNNHGTHTMGTMVGRDTGNIIGVAPLAKWIGCRNMERGNGQLSTYLDCFEWFLAPTDLDGLNPDPSLAPHVINNSWYCSEGEGCNPENWNLLNEAVINLKAAGVVVVVSAGNEGPNCETTTGPPGIFEASFSVGATMINDTIAGFSSRGPVSIDSSFRMKPDISAPGRGVRSVIRGGGFASFNGTSMAGPHVAGAVALILSANPDLIGEVAIIEDIIKETAAPKFSDQECGGLSSQVIPNPIYGYGRLNVLKAVEKALSVSSNAEISNSDVFKIYPNPTSEIINIESVNSKLTKYSLYTTDHKLIKSSSFQYNTILEIGFLNTGIYVLELTNNSQKLVTKIIKI